MKEQQEEKLFVCPKVKECKDLKTCYHKKPHNLNPKDEVCEKVGNCPACIPVEPEPVKSEEKKIHAEFEFKQPGQEKCKNCINYYTHCNWLISSRTGEETECDWIPSRFRKGLPEEIEQLKKALKEKQGTGLKPSDSGFNKLDLKQKIEVVVMSRLNGFILRDVLSQQQADIVSFEIERDISELLFQLRQSIGKEVIGKAVKEISEWYGYYSAEDEGLSKRVDNVLEKLEQKLKEAAK